MKLEAVKKFSVNHLYSICPLHERVSLLVAFCVDFEKGILWKRLWIRSTFLHKSNCIDELSDEIYFILLLLQMTSLDCTSIV